MLVIDNATVILGLQEELRVLRHMHESDKREIAKWRSAFERLKDEADKKLEPTDNGAIE